MAFAIGVDLGGSHVTAGLVSDDGVIHAQHELDITDRSFDAVVTAISSVISDAMKATKEKIIGIGLGSPGNIEPISGAVRYSPNFGWVDVPLGERLREAFGVPIFVANDARCATLGEFEYGTGRGRNDFALLTLGTGIGGGVVAGGHLVLGNCFGAGEIGHHQIRPTDGFICGCGKIGCLEAQASGTGLMRHAYALAASFPRSALLDVPRGKLGPKKIRKAAEAGDLHALSAWKNFCADLAIGLANIVAFTNPECIALGGGVSTAQAFLLDAVRPRVDELTTMVPKGSTEIVIAKLGNDAGQVGAATMAFRGGLKTDRDA